ncbi:palmitoyltransferase swf1 [Trapelia coarctata]|nr:palmitoyltransferase swf1 [Trapelia coarctata]
MLLSLSFLLTYGAYLAYRLLDGLLQDGLIRRSHGSRARSHWSAGRTYMQQFDMWAWAFTEDVRIGSVGLLALFTAPLAWGLFLYHIYLIWAGMTTNESFKWDDWKEDVRDGLVYKRDIPPSPAGRQNGMDVEPKVRWPVSSNQQLLNRVHQQPVPSSEDLDLQQQGWSRVHSLRELENIYDLGFWDNMKDIFHGIGLARSMRFKVLQGLKLCQFPTSLKPKETIQTAWKQYDKDLCVLWSAVGIFNTTSIDKDEGVMVQSGYQATIVSFEEGSSMLGS